ncbi:MAG TPA: FecR family protein, partial [Gammaproteobacteria bacterium]|nr:FecR family protein [Gammaproteobacteria bacterium]
QGLIERFLPEEDRWTAIGGAALHEGLRLRTGGDGSIALRLADGGSLRLHNDTELVLATASFELLSGTVYFDSAGRVPGNSVEIVTPLGRVRDIGTQFEVRATSTSLRVRTRSGEIAVLDSPAAQPLASQTGEEIELFAAGQVSRRSFAPDDPQWGWAEALAVAPDLATPTVLAYLEWIAAETGRQLRFESEAVRLQANVARFLGDPAGLLPTELLITITATSDFSYALTSDGGILIGRDDRVQ